MAGVLEGSILGPLLFLIYINELANVINYCLKLFAGDTCPYGTVDEPASSATVLKQLKQYKIMGKPTACKFQSKQNNISGVYK